jgi:asparagine synthase (glutamine-hydrolysing)
MLSGGLDSSLVVALMARHVNGPVRTFAVGFAEDPGNELADARLVASAFGAEHHELELSFEDAAVPLDELLWSLDEPLADLSALGLHALSKLAAGHVTVALTGQGADELFAGYPVHRNAVLSGWWQHVPRIARPLGSLVLPVVPLRYRRAARVALTVDPVDRFLSQVEMTNERERATLIRSELTGPESVSSRALLASLLGPTRGTPLAQALYLSQQVGLVDDMLHYFDRVSMAHSVEIRVPFLDHEVVEAAASVPDRMKVDRHLVRKVLLRRVARGLIPASVIDKPKTGFFSTAATGWLRAQFSEGSEVRDRLLRSDLAVGRFLDARAVASLVESAGRGEQANLRCLLAVLMLEVWLSDFLPRALAPTAPERTQVVVAR